MLRNLVQRMALAALLAASLATAAFALNSTAHAANEGCCLVVASCMPEVPCVSDDDCGGNPCCLQCGG